MPLSITGKAEELDRELPGQLTSFTESVTKTGSNFDELKTQHAAAVKAVEAENKKKMDDKKKGNGSKTASTPPASPTPTADFKDGKPVFGSKTTPPAGRKREPVRHSNVDGGDHDEWPAEDPSTAPQPQHPTNPRVPIPIDTREEERERGLKINDHRNHGSRIPL